MTTFNIYAQVEEQQRIEQDFIALEYKIQAETLEAIAAEAKAWGKKGCFPQDPNSEIYFKAWCEGFRAFALSQLEIAEKSNWEDVVF